MAARRRDRGFFIVWGSRMRISSQGGSVERECPSCRKVTELEGKVVRRWFTLYFCPVFPMGEATAFTQCKGCKAQFRATIEQFRTAPSRDAGASFQAAIGLYNELRETPEDSAKLHRLLTMYGALHEPRELVSAALAYPDAAHVSDACMILVAQAYEQLGEKNEALKWATAALAINPANDGAQALQQKVLPSGSGDLPLLAIGG